MAVGAGGCRDGAVPACAPRLVFNPSASVPVGWWLVRTAPVIEVGDYVLVELPPAVAAFASERHYLPAGVPILKRVAALAGQCMCVVEGVVMVDGEPLARALTRSAARFPVTNFSC